MCCRDTVRARRRLAPVASARGALAEAPGEKGGLVAIPAAAGGGPERPLENALGVPRLVPGLGGRRKTWLRSASAEKCRELEHGYGHLAELIEEGERVELLRDQTVHLALDSRCLAWLSVVLVVCDPVEKPGSASRTHPW